VAFASGAVVGLAIDGDGNVSLAVLVDHGVGAVAPGDDIRTAVALEPIVARAAAEDVVAGAVDVLNNVALAFVAA